jgi:hypothetical protein
MTISGYPTRHARRSSQTRRLKRAHSYVGRIEVGDRRLDLPEFIEWCELLGADPVETFKRIVRK